ncbi:MAG: sterol desaturase family protein [Hyphomicrobiales bacterium]|nr:sterol desaturase family protein [Hyphomicrobiales bacterium]
MFQVVTGGPAGFAVFAVSAAAVALEAVTAARRGLRIHDRGELVATAIVALGHAGLRFAEGGVVVAVYAELWAHRLASIDATRWSGAIALFLAFEFVYYWYHRATHRVRWLWATHAVHHSTRRFNLTAALRLGWTGAVSGHFLFFAPLVFAGFSPAAVLTMGAIDLAWQFFVHTEMAPSLGPLEAILNTPRHHAVHHARNPDCLDRNFGGVLIVFDRLFGTFAERPAEPLVYGLVGRDPGGSVVEVVFGEWRRLIADLRAAPSIAVGLAGVFGPPSEVAPAFPAPVASAREQEIPPR